MAEGECPPHWWKLDSDKAIALDKPEVIGRKAVCKKCGMDSIQKGRVHVGN